MAYSYVQYTGNGATVAFSIPFQYISADYLEVRVDGVLTTAYTLPTAASVQMNVAPAVGAVLDIRRNTPKTSRLVDFQDASILTEASLDLSADQAFHVAQETLDDSEAALKLDTDNKYDVGSHVLKNVADPVSAQDAATKNWAETAGTSFVNASAVSASSAATSASNAAASQLAAAASASAADLSETNAAASEVAAAASAATATTQAGTATTQAGIATTQAGIATTQAGIATTQASNASTSASNAASSASAAAASYDSFDDRYLGPKASAPTLDNDGNALLTGALYFNTGTGAMMVWSGSSWGSAALSGIIGAISDGSAGAFSYRNKIINGSMIVSQRGVSFPAAADATFPADRFNFWRTTTGALTASRELDGPTTALRYSMRFTVTTADTSIASADYASSSQSIEGYSASDLRGKTFTLSFWVRSSAPGIYGVSFRTTASEYSYIAEITVNAANTWEFKTVTVVGGIPVGYTVDAHAATGLSVGFALMAGSNYHGTKDVWQAGNKLTTANQTNLYATVGNIFAVTGVQLELGAVATPFELRPYESELALCQRYYCVVGLHVYGYQLINFTLMCNHAFPVTMRAIPTVTLVSNGTVVNATLPTAHAIRESGFGYGVNAVATGTCGMYGGSATAEAEL